MLTVSAREEAVPKEEGGMTLEKKKKKKKNQKPLVAWEASAEGPLLPEGGADAQASLAEGCGADSSDS